MTTKISKNILAHTSNLDNENPAIYVGTYHKYNCGSLEGEWLDLATFDSWEDFLHTCRELHADEADPEFMAQDFCDMPQGLYSECFQEADFDRVKQYIELADEYSAEAVAAFVDNYGAEYLDNFASQYVGEYRDEEDFAWQIFEDCYAHDMPEFAARYFDIAAFARDLFIDGYTFVDGFVFADC
jgi:antirestriction protein